MLKFLLMLVGLLWLIWSFVLTDKALLYSKSTPFVYVQNYLWQYADNRLALTIVFAVLILSLFAFYILFLFKPQVFSMRVWVFPIFFFLGCLVLSNPALSYDLFNYTFDAKLVMHYHLDPHTTSAYSFDGKDDWVRFMRNTFFPTTYGYVWTVISLVPYILGLGKLLLVFLAFKGMNFLALVFLYIWQKKIMGAKNLWFLFANPLFLIESLGSAHNDIYMMLLAFMSLGILFRIKRLKVLPLLLSLGLLLLSVQIKRATLFLLPVWIFIFLYYLLPEKYRRLFRWPYFYSADISACLLFLPLTTELSRQFHPWYLIWSLSFIPFIRSRLLRIILITFSFFSLCRYLPILYINVYSDSLLQIQKLITWSALPIGMLIWYIVFLCSKYKSRVK